MLVAVVWGVCATVGYLSVQSAVHAVIVAVQHAAEGVRSSARQNLHRSRVSFGWEAGAGALAAASDCDLCEPKDQL